MRKGLGLAGLIVGVPLPLCFVPWLLSGGVARKPLYLARKLIRVGILSLILALIPKSVGSRSAQSLCRASMSCERKTVSLIAWNSRHKAMPTWTRRVTFSAFTIRQPGARPKPASIAVSAPSVAFAPGSDPAQGQRHGGCR